MSRQNVRTIPMVSQSNGGGRTVVDINGGGGGGSLLLRFNSNAGQIQTTQNIAAGSAGGQVQRQSIMAEPDILIQDVKKPVIQKVRMQITPYRKVFQEVRPVHEQIETVVAKGMEGGKYGGSGSYGGGSKSSYSGDYSSY
ncbi:DFP1 [Sarcoptes scabiei]|nr:DFP1 [Sarcoptes scabiei]